MPSVHENLKTWEEYSWVRSGEEWSSLWGNSDAQWFGTILPRIHRFLPAGTILEIGPGFGRWTQYLKNYCERLIAVDLSPHCIEACKEKLSAHDKISYHVNDGRSLAMIPDRSVNFVFSFDSLVHVNADVIEAYLSQLAKKLTPNGAGFIHHSNYRMYPAVKTLSNMVPEEIRSFLSRMRVVTNYDGHWRGPDVDATVVEACCRQVGLACISQELVNWAGRLLIDAFSTFTVAGSRWDRPNRILRNRKFLTEAAVVAKLSPLYSDAPDGPTQG